MFYLFLKCTMITSNSDNLTTLLYRLNIKDSENISMFESALNDFHT